MDIRFHVLLLVLSTCINVVHGRTEVVETARMHAHWSSGRRMITTTHVSCTLPITEPLEYFRLNFTTQNLIISIKTWSLEETSVEGNSAYYVSKRTMYPPRIVLNFHVNTFLPPDNSTCTWAIGAKIQVNRPMPRLPQRNRRQITGVSDEGEPTGLAPPLDWRSPGEGSPDEQTCGLQDIFMPALETILPPLEALPGRMPGLPGRGLLLPPLSAYQSAIEKSMYFYAAQRSGPFEREAGTSSPIHWLNQSGLNHVAPDGTDLTGGWYNGNDLVKTNLPMASSVTLLAAGLYMWPQVYSHPDIKMQILDTLHWPLDYFQKCWKKDTETLYVQVGDFKNDRDLFERADADAYKDLVTDNKWPFQSVTPDNPGSDVAAEMASAMALSSMALNSIEFSDEAFEYQSSLLDTAMELYDFAVKYKGVYSDHVTQTNSDFPSYTSTGYKDELCLAAITLFFASNNETYLRDARIYFRSAVNASELFSWDNKFPLCAVFLARHTEKNKYKQYVADHITSWLDWPSTPEGLAYRSEKGTLRYTANAVLIALAAEEFRILDDPQLVFRTMDFSIRQIGYMLGQNSEDKSYLIGFGDNYPANPFHKNSACPNSGTPCGWGFYDSEILNNNNELVGALVGGPNINDKHRDSRQEKLRNSVAIDYNAGFQSALAGLHNLQEIIGLMCNSAPGFTGSPGFTSSTYETWGTGGWWGSTSTTEGFTDEVTSTPAPTQPLSTTHATPTTPTTQYTTTNLTAVPPQPTVFRYGDALGKSILFYEAQRDGELSPNHPVPWRRSTVLYDFFGKTRNGGWFDDGTSLRTTITMASSVSLLAWGGLAFKTGYQQAGQLDNLHTSLLAPLTYFRDMWRNKKQIVVKSTIDEARLRAYWLRPEDVSGTNSQLLYMQKFLGTNEGGADIVADMATAMTIGSQVLANSTIPLSSEMSAELLEVAKELYQHASGLSGAYNDADSLHYSGSLDASDELCLSAAWLYQTTFQDQYRFDAHRYWNTQTVYKKELTWQNKHVLCELMLYEITRNARYRTGITAFLDHWMGSDMIKTPQGLAWNGEKGPLAHAANAAFVSLVAASYGINTEVYQAWAKSQIDYILGKNDMAYSYLIGYGDRFPRRPHHMGSSCPDHMAECDWSIYNAPGANPHTLTGALVSGPDAQDFFEDARTNYTMNRVAIDYNAGFQSALAGLVEVYGTEVTTAPSVSSASMITTNKPITAPSATAAPMITTSKPTTKAFADKGRGPGGPLITSTDTSKATTLSSSVTIAFMLLFIGTFA